MINSVTKIGATALAAGLAAAFITTDIEAAVRHPSQNRAVYKNERIEDLKDQAFWQFVLQHPYKTKTKVPITLPCALTPCK